MQVWTFSRRSEAEWTRERATVIDVTPGPPLPGSLLSLSPGGLKSNEVRAEMSATKSGLSNCARTGKSLWNQLVVMCEQADRTGQGQV